LVDEAEGFVPSSVGCLSNYPFFILLLGGAMAMMEVSGKIGGTKKCLRKICTSYVSANQHLLDPDELLLNFSKCHLLVACDRHAKHLTGQQGI
jgi:hypothetical protein